MAKTSLPPGFRFHPTDVELVQYYLKRKVMGKSLRCEVISEIELYKFSPWDLPDKSCLQSKDREWYFFCPRDRKYANGSRASRTTDIGYWKTTGKDRSVIHNSQTVGMKKTLVFHNGRAPRGDRTDWVMYEYRLADKELVNLGFSQDAFVLCKIFQKSGLGPKNGEQYGAPFKEEDWEYDEVNNHEVSIPCVTYVCPRPLEDQAILLEPVLQQSVTSGVDKLPSSPHFLEVGSLEQLAEDLNDSSCVSENANGKCYAKKQDLGEVSQDLLDTQVNPAVWEISGHMVRKQKKDYEEASEDYALRLLAEVSLSEGRFQEVKAYIFEAIGLVEPGEETDANENEGTSFQFPAREASYFPEGILVQQ